MSANQANSLAGFVSSQTLWRVDGYPQMTIGPVLMVPCGHHPSPAPTPATTATGLLARRYDLPAANAVQRAFVSIEFRRQH